MNSYQIAFGQRVRQLRLDRGVTQEEVAHRAGIHVTYLSGIERGVRNPSLTSIYALAAALEVPVSQLFAFVPPPPRRIALTNEPREALPPAILVA